jgi:26S proteasome regulatory subunit T3
VVTEKTALFHELQEEDLYTKYKKLERHLELLEIQESYIKDEQLNLKRELIRAQEEVKRIQSVPLVIGQFLEAIDQHTGIVGSTTGSNYVVRILSTLDRELLKPSSSVALHRHSNALVDILPPEADSSISMLAADEKPDVSYQDVGGMDSQKQEIREAVELPLTHFDLYKKIGIDPPRGVLLYGPPGIFLPLTRYMIFSYTSQELERLCSSKPSLIIQQPPSFEWSVVSLYKSIWEKVLAWFVIYSDWLARTSLQSSSLMKSMRLPPNVSMHKLVPIERFSVYCWNCLTRWTASTRVAMSR